MVAKVRTLSTKFKPPRFDYPQDPVTTYALRVCDRTITAGPEVHRACVRHLTNIAGSENRGKYVWLPEKLDYPFGFYRDILRVDNDDDYDEEDTKPFHLLDWQQFYVGSIYGWRERSDPRLRRFIRSLLLTAKGSGKTPLLSGMSILETFATRRRRPEGYVVAVNYEQAGVAFRDLVSMINSSPTLQRRLIIKGGLASPKEIWNLDSTGFIKRMAGDQGAIGKGRQGPRPSFIFADEYQQHTSSKVLGILARGFKRVKNPLLVIAANAGTGATTACGREYHMALRVLAEEDEDETYFPFVCSLHENDDPFDPKQKDCWHKANPSLRHGMPGEVYIEREISRSKNVVSEKVDVARDLFCIWSQATTPWLDPEQWAERLVDKLTPRKERKKWKVYLALDLATTNDFCAATAIWVAPNGDLEIEAVVWAPEEELEERSRIDNVEYGKWVANGDLTLTEGRTINYEALALWIKEFDRKNKLQGIAYDAKYMAQLSDYLRAEKVKLTADPSEPGILIIPHWQGSIHKLNPKDVNRKKIRKQRSDALPVLHMTRSLSEFETKFINRQVKIKRNAAPTSAVTSAIVKRKDSVKARWLDKGNANSRIDAAVAMVMAAGFALAPAPDTRPGFTSADYEVFHKRPEE